MAATCDMWACMLCPADALAGSLGVEVIDHLKAIREAIVAQQAPPKESKAVAFSSVTSHSADDILTDLEIKVVDGSAEEPIIISEGTPEALPFDYAAYADENSGTPYLMEHHQRMLELYEVPFGRGG